MKKIQEISRIKFATNWRFPASFAVNTEGVSMAVPDQSYSIRDILTKFTRMPEIVNQSLVYDGDDNEVGFDDPVLNMFNDLSDMDQVQSTLNDMYEKRKEAAEKLAAEKKAAEIAAAQTPPAGS